MEGSAKADDTGSGPGLMLRVERTWSWDPVASQSPSYPHDSVAWGESKSKSEFGFKYRSTVVSHDSTLPRAAGPLYIYTFSLSSPPAMAEPFRQTWEALELEGGRGQLAGEPPPAEPASQSSPLLSLRGPGPALLPSRPRAPLRPSVAWSSVCHHSPLCPGVPARPL